MVHFASDFLSPPNGERVMVMGKHLKIKHLPITALSAIGND
jgi:hypothetical protein